MKEIGVTVYVPQPKHPQLSYRITTGGVEDEAGTVMQSRVFKLNDGQALELIALAVPQED